MKKDIHPDYHTNAKMTCACGNIIETSSTREKVNIELCSKCHPFYTGKQKIVDTARRVEKFVTRTASKTTSLTNKAKKEKEAARAQKKADKRAALEKAAQ